MMNLVPLSITYPIVHSSPLHGMYCLYTRSSHDSPSMHFLIAEGSLSSPDASSTSRVVIALGVADTATHRTYSSARGECLLLLSSLVAKLDNESGMSWLVPHFKLVRLHS